MSIHVNTREQEGLRTVIDVSVPYSVIKERLSQVMDRFKEAKLPGFRPGKVPLAVLEKRFGAEAHAEVLQDVVASSTQEAFKTSEIRPSTQPKVTITQTFQGEKDLTYTVEVYTTPTIEEVDYKTLSLTRHTIVPDDTEVQEALRRLARSSLEDVEREAALGDVVVLDFEGRVEGRPFQGGTAKEASVELGKGGFLPGFEEQIVGHKAGEVFDITLTFPDSYREDLKGREGVFSVTLQRVAIFSETVLDDAFAHTLGAESLEALEKQIRDEIQRRCDSTSQERLKRDLLDALCTLHHFDLPPPLVESEFKGIWQAFEEQRARGQDTPQEKSDEDLKKEYKALAHRRVMLGILFSELGGRHNISVTEQELQEAVRSGQVQRERRALESLQSALFEHKVTNFLLALATIKEVKVPRDQWNSSEENV